VRVIDGTLAHQASKSDANKSLQDRSSGPATKERPISRINYGTARSLANSLTRRQRSRKTLFHFLYGSCGLRGKFRRCKWLKDASGGPFENLAASFGSCLRYILKWLNSVTSQETECRDCALRYHLAQAFLWRWLIRGGFIV